AQPVTQLAVEFGQLAGGGLAIAVADDQLDERFWELHLVMDRRAWGGVDQPAAGLRDLRLAAAEHAVDPPGDPLDLAGGLAQLGKPPLERRLEDGVDLARKARQADDRNALERDLEAGRQARRVRIDAR